MTVLTHTVADPFTSNRGYQGILNSFNALPIDLSSPYLTNGTCGLDKGRITVPVHGKRDDVFRGIRNVLGRYEIKGQVSFPDFPNLYISSCGTPAPAVQIEFNFADFTKSVGANLCPFELAPDVVSLVIDQLVQASGNQLTPIFLPRGSSIIEPKQYPKTWERDVYYSKLELARDFVVTDPRFQLEQLQYARPKRAKGITAHINGTSINTLTHPAGSQSARMTLYNKSYLADKAEPTRYPAGTFRFEVKLPRELIKRRHISTVEWGTPNRMQWIIEDYWGYSNYHTHLLHESNVHETLFDLYDETDAALLIGYASAAANGLAGYFDPADRALYERELSGLGFKSNVKLELQGTSYAELDFQSGTLKY